MYAILVGVILTAALTATVVPAASLPWHPAAGSAVQLPDSLENARLARRYFIAGTTLQLQGNRHAEAILEFQESLRFDSAAVTLAAIARSYMELKKLDRAETCVQQALRLDSTRAEVWELLAELRIASGNYDDGITAYERILLLEPSRRQLYTLARLYEPRDARKAIALFERIAVEDPSIDVYVRLAALHERLRNDGAVIEALENGRRIDPRDLDICARLIEAYLRAGRATDAFDVARTWRRPAVGSASVHVVWGHLLQGLLTDSLVAHLQADVTVQIIDSAIAFFPESFQMTSMAAAVAYSMQDSIRGVQAARLAGAVARTDADVLIQLAGMVVSYNYPMTAAELLLEWQPEHAYNPRFLQAIGDAFLYVPDGDRALPYYYAALDLDPSLSDVWLQLGAYYDRSQQHDSAMTCYQRVLRHDPTNPMALNNSAYMLAEQDRDLELARQRSFLALQQHPDLPAYLDTYAWVLFKLGHLAEARQYIEQAIRLGGSATHYDHLGDILELSGDVDGAIRAWQMSLEKDPERVHVLRKLDRYR